VEFDATLPTGHYDQAYSANPGCNLLTLEPYYGLTYYPSKEWETSWRFFYAVNGENKATKVHPGQLLHINYAASREVFSKLRLGLSGYLLQQMTEDKVSGVKQDGSREFAYALGPVAAYVGNGLAIMVSHPMDIIARNRFLTQRTTIEMVFKF
jgi:hypothetical protein